MNSGSSPSRGDPEPLNDVLGRLFAQRGWGRKSERLRLESAWADAAGPAVAPHTQLVSLRRGVLEVVVDNAVLLQELTHFHKRRLLARLRQTLGTVPVADIRFRAGVVTGPAADRNEAS